MSRFLKWAAVILVGLFLVFVLAAAVFSFFRFGGMPMMARGFRGPFVFGGSYRYLGLFFLLGRLLIPLALAVLLILGGFAIGRGLANPRMPVAAATCKNCGRPVQANWNNCPYCGASLKNDAPITDPGENIS